MCPYPSIFTNITCFSHGTDEIQKHMPLPEPTVPPPHTQVPSQSLQAAGSPGPGTGFVPPETGPCCCPCSRSCSRPGADPPSSCAPVSASDSSLHLANSHPSPTSSISFPGPHLGLPVQQWPPHKPSLQSPITKGKSPPAAALGPYGPSCRPSFLLLLGSSI